MSMVIPEHVDFMHFYAEAKKKGISVVSRFTGVHVAPNKTGRLYFRGQIIVNGVLISKCFPFTKAGEVQAHKYYLRMKDKHPDKKFNTSQKTML